MGLNDCFEEDSEVNARVQHLRYVPDQPFANEFQYMIITPVEPVTQNPCYDPLHPEYIPYFNEPNAPNQGISNDTYTYEMPHYCRNVDPSCPQCNVGNVGLNRGFGDWEGGSNPYPSVPAGLASTIVAYSHQPRNGNNNWYCDGTSISAQECGDTHCNDLFESIWRDYFGRSAVIPLEWTDDPQKRGWKIAYENLVWGWFTQDTYWIRISNNPQGSGPWRWNAWYKGCVRFHLIEGDLADTQFSNWIRSQDSGFGVEYRPTLSACNDVLWNCAGQENGISGNVFPLPDTQNNTFFGSDPPPCLQAGKGYSRWFMGGGGSCENVDSVRLPQQGYYHRITRKKFTAYDLSTFETQSGWAKLMFQTNPPQIVAMDDEPPIPQTTIYQILTGNDDGYATNPGGLTNFNEPTVLAGWFAAGGGRFYRGYWRYPDNAIPGTGSIDQVDYSFVWGAAVQNAAPGLTVGIRYLQYDDCPPLNSTYGPSNFFLVNGISGAGLLRSPQFGTFTFPASVTVGQPFTLSGSFLAAMFIEWRNRAGWATGNHFVIELTATVSNSRLWHIRSFNNNPAEAMKMTVQWH